MQRVLLPLLIVGGVLMAQKSVWANAGDINPDLVKGFINAIKEVEPKLRGIATPLILGVIATESSFRTKVVSSAGAVGLMQVKPDTYQWLKGLYPDFPWQNNGLENPIENLIAGMAFMLWIRNQGLDFFGELQAYNTGVSGYKNGSRARDYATKVLVNSFAFIV